MNANFRSLLSISSGSFNFPLNCHDPSILFLQFLSPLNRIRYRRIPTIRQLLIPSIIWMHPIPRHRLRIKPSPHIHHNNRALIRRLPSSPLLNLRIQRNNTLAALCAIRRVHRNDFGDEDLHAGLLCAHLIHELAERGGDFLRRAVVPHVVGAEVHHDDVGLRGREPWWELVLVRNVDC